MRCKKELLYKEDAEYLELHYRTWLKYKYINEQRTLKDIASIIGCDIASVSRAIERFSIPIGNKTPVRRDKTPVKIMTKFPELQDKEWLSKKYWKEGLFSSKKLGELIGCSETTVLNAMKKHIIKTVPTGNKLDYLDLSKEKMEELYITNNLTAQEIGKYIGCNGETILRRLKKYNIPIKYHIRYRKQNLLEQKVDKTLQDLYPNEWKFNGCGECGVVLGGLIPDFINVNGMKAVIEVFGDVYHDPEKAFGKVPWKSQEFGRKAVFSQLGYECIILRECDLNDNCEKTIVDNVEATRGAM